MNAQETAGTTFVFREPENADELLSLLRLRYVAFRQSRLKGFVKEHPDQLDIDPWDAKSMHYGLFQRKDGGDEPAGYIRVVGFSRTVQWPLLVDLASRFDIANSAITREPVAPLPVLSYDDPNRALWNEFEKITAAGHSLAEPGRIAMLPEYRSMAVCRHLVESTIALYFFGRHLTERALVSCARDHRSFYQRFGFKLIPGSENVCAKVSWVLSGLTAGPEDIPTAIRNRTELMSRQFELIGEIVRSSTSTTALSAATVRVSPYVETNKHLFETGTKNAEMPASDLHENVITNTEAITKTQNVDHDRENLTKNSGTVTITFAAFVRASIILAATLLLPLAGVPALLVNPKIIVLVLTGYVMLLSQHELRKDDADQTKETDKGSVLMILIAAVASQIIPLIEWGYFSSDHTGNPIITSVGLLVILSGLGLRIWAIRAMGEFFTVTVQILPNHKVIKHGPFAIVRHPCYLGAVLTLIGTGVFLNAPIGTAIGAIITILAYVHRLKAEEKLLAETFGSEYETYMHTTPMLLPGLRSRFSFKCQAIENTGEWVAKLSSESRH